MNHIYRDPKPGQSCRCERPHAPFTERHRIDTSDMEKPMGNPSCVCGSGVYEVPHHT